MATETISLREAAGILNIAPATVKNMVKRGELPAIEEGEGKGKRYVFKKGDITRAGKALGIKAIGSTAKQAKAPRVKTPVKSAAAKLGDFGGRRARKPKAAPPDVRGGTITKASQGHAAVTYVPMAASQQQGLQLIREAEDHIKAAFSAFVNAMILGAAQ